LGVCLAAIGEAKESDSVTFVMFFGIIGASGCGEIVACAYLLKISGIMGTAGWGGIGECAYLLIINAEKAQALRGIASLF